MGNKQSLKKKSKEKSYLLQTCDEHQGSINCLDISEDGSVLATGSDDKTIRLWSSKTEMVECIAMLEGHDDYITMIVICGKYLLSSSADKTIRKWQMSTCECLLVLLGHESVVNKITCNGDYVFSVSYDKNARCWDFDTGECMQIFSGHKNNVTSLLYISQEKSAFDAINSIKKKQRETKLKHNYDEEVDEGIDLLITGSMDSLAKSWSIKTGKCIHTFSGHTGPITCCAVDYKNEFLFTGSSDHSIKSWDISSGELLKTFNGHNTTVLSLLASKKLLYSTSADHSARCWVMEFGDCTKVYKDHTHSIPVLIENNGLIYTGCGDTFIRCFDAKSATLKRTFKGHTGAINCLKLVSNRLFTGSFDGTVRVWDTSDLFAENKTNASSHTNMMYEENERPTNRLTVENEKAFRVKSAVKKSSGFEKKYDFDSGYDRDDDRDDDRDFSERFGRQQVSQALRFDREREYV